MTLIRAAIAALLIGAAPAQSFEIGATLDALDYSHSACIGRTDHDGEVVTDAESDRACRELVAVIYTLLENGYCYQDQTWKPCQQPVYRLLTPGLMD